MSTFKTIAIALLAGAIGAAGAVHFAPRDGGETAAHQETAYERVMRTGTLRCGYFLVPNLLEKDVNTKKIYGLYPSLLEEMGNRLSLKIEWTEEVGMATMFEGLKTGRYDALCNGVATTPARARVAAFTRPVIYMLTSVYARADDRRFDENFKAINDPLIKFAILEGDISQAIKNEDFPHAQTVSLPNLTERTDLMVQLTTKKADVIGVEPSMADRFIASNPNSIKRVPGPPLRTHACSLAVDVGEEELKSLLNTTIESLLSTGFVERTFIGKPELRDIYYLPAQPWRRAGG